MLIVLNVVGIGNVITFRVLQGCRTRGGPIALDSSLQVDWEVSFNTRVRMVGLWETGANGAIGWQGHIH